MNPVFIKFFLVFANALGKAIVREVAWLTVKAAREEMEARDRYVRRTQRPVVMRKDGQTRISKNSVTYEPN